MGCLSQLRFDERRNEPSNQEKEHATDENGRDEVCGMHVHSAPFLVVYWKVFSNRGQT